MRKKAEQGHGQRNTQCSQETPPDWLNTSQTGTEMEMPEALSENRGVYPPTSFLLSDFVPSVYYCVFCNGSI